MLVSLSSSAFAGIGATAASSPESLTMASCSISGETFSSNSTAGDNSSGVTSGSTYSFTAGVPSAVRAAQSPEAQGPDLGAPHVSNLKFDGSTIRNNDLVNSGVLFTASITDETGLNTTESKIIIDSASTAFSALTLPSSYDATAQILSVKNSFDAGTHTIAVFAKDILGNITTSETITFIVNNEDLKIQGTALNYPNPFAPPAQTTKICYMLNKDSAVSIYLFNMVGQLVKKIDAASGAQGGKAGYNEVSWDGVTDFGDVAGNDVYICKIISGGKVLGKVKIAVLK